jgi:hypothetical protein
MEVTAIGLLLGEGIDSNDTRLINVCKTNRQNVEIPTKEFE